MVRIVQTIIGGTGYRHQLDRARRFLDRVQPTNADWAELNDVEFQYLTWEFFQNCWHVKDWLKNDPLVPQATKDAAIVAAHHSSELMLCRDLRNGTKHLGPRPGEASHHHIDASVAPGWGITNIDCIIDDGSGHLISGMKLAQDCIAEWERILQSQGLATA